MSTNGFSKLLRIDLHEPWQSGKLDIVEAIRRMRGGAVTAPWSRCRAWHGHKILILRSADFSREIEEITARQNEFGICIEIGEPENFPDLPSLCREQRFTAVVVDDATQVTPSTRERLRGGGVKHIQLGDLYEDLTRKVAYTAIDAGKTPPDPYHLLADFIRWLVSVILAVGGLILTLPLFFVIGVAVWFEDRHEVFFIQERLGKKGRPFNLFKFRSMTPPGETVLTKDWMKADWVVEEASRVTKVGRVLRTYKLDELPQLFNVIRGNMNAVGPRAETREGFEERSRMISGYEHRLTVKPGMAGWGLINTYQDAIGKLQVDLYYIKYRSLRFDLIIFLMTAWQIVRLLVNHSARTALQFLRMTDKRHGT